MRPEGNRLFVWDLPVRLFHWCLVICVATAAITGFLAPENWLAVHYWSGSIIGFLVLFRLGWGLIGTRYAKFSSFSFPVRETIAHIRGVLCRQPSHYIGHNPAGGLMVFALLVVLSALTISGLVVLGGQENIGILAGFISFATAANIYEFHETLAGLLLAMIAVHLVGVAVESLLSKQNLVQAMITGHKDIPGLPVQWQPTLRRQKWKPLLLASVLLLGLAGTSWTLLQTPPSGYIAMPVNAAYKSECGECHQLYHPSLLPASSWKKMMAELQDHFGEDASLDVDSTRKISLYLQKYAAERWDSEAANSLRRVAPGDPLRITASSYWQHRHRHISKSVFAQSNVKSKGNCVACHRDAPTGHFDDEAIAIPPTVKITSTGGPIPNRKKEIK